MNSLVDFFQNTPLIDTIIQHFWTIVATLFALLLTLIGLANRKLPNRDDIKITHFRDQNMGDNRKLWQRLTKFQHNTHLSSQTSQPTNPSNNVANASPSNQHLSGIHAISEGEYAFNARIILTQLAEQSLDLQYYMWHDDASGRLLFFEVWQAAERGVKVRILLDDNNTAGMDAVLQTLDNHPNIALRLFNPFMNRRFRVLGYVTALKRLNRRMHNKSFTVDNQVSIFGGRNIGDEYFNADKDMNFADLDVMAIGQVVDEISQDFDHYWNAPASYPLHKIVSKTYEPVDLSKTADEKYAVSSENYRQSLGKSDFLNQLDMGKLDFEWVKVEFVSDNPDKVLDKHQKGDNLIEKIQDTLITPKHSLTIVSPYFVPMDKWTQRFVDLAKNGIELNILTNSLTANDVMAVHAGYMRYRKPLLEGNVKLYELKSRLKQKIIEDNPLAHPLTTLKKFTDAGSQKLNETFEDTFEHHPKKNPHRTEQNPFTGSRRQNRRHRHEQRPRNKFHLIRNAGSSLHAKTFSVDGEKLFVGSFNFDPRSATLNTEMGAIIYSPVLAKQLDDTIERWTHELSYVVSMNEGKIGWADNSHHPIKAFDTEPESTWQQRLIVWFISKLPIEDFL